MYWKNANTVTILQPLAQPTEESLETLLRCAFFSKTIDRDDKPKGTSNGISRPSTSSASRPASSSVDATERIEVENWPAPGGIVIAGCGIGEGDRDDADDTLNESTSDMVYEGRVNMRMCRDQDVTQRLAFFVSYYTIL